MNVRLRIKRFNPSRDSLPQFVTYEVDVEPTDRVLDALNAVKWKHDGSLTYRRSCAHGMCGSDAMRINGRNHLACKALVKDMGQSITVEPLLGFRVIKDLVVDMDPFWEKYDAIRPYLIADEPPTYGERVQSAAQRARFDDTTKCILCAACTGSCPIFWSNQEWLGPAALVNAHRFVFDSRDQGGAERLDILNGRIGVWRCRTIFNCTEACPRDIKVTKAIEELKRALLYSRV